MSVVQSRPCVTSTHSVTTALAPTSASVLKVTMATAQIAEVRIYMFNHVLISGGIFNYIFRHHLLIQIHILGVV